MSQDNLSLNEPQQFAEKPANSARSADIDCDRVLALIPAFTIGATDPDEEEFIKAKLGGCPEATAELARYMTLADALHYSASPIQSSPALADALQEAIKVSASPQPLDLSTRRDTAKHGRDRVRQTLSGRYTRLGLALGVGLLCLMLVSNIYWLFQVQQLHSQQDQVLSHLHSDIETPKR